MGSWDGFGSEPTHLFNCFPKSHPLPYGAAAWESLGCPCKRTRAQLSCWGLAHSSHFPFCVASCVFPSRHFYGTTRVKAPPFSAGISQSYHVAQPLWGGLVRKRRCHCSPSDPVSGDLHEEGLASACVRSSS